MYITPKVVYIPVFEMFGLLGLLLFLVSTAVATYGDTASIAAKINLRQLQLYNSGSYETLVDEVSSCRPITVTQRKIQLYFPDATISVDGFGFVARGHDQILAIIKRNAGYMNSVSLLIMTLAKTSF